TEVAPEGREILGTVVTDEDHADAEALELGKPGHDPVDLTGPVHSAEVTEEDEERRPAHESAEAADTVRPVHGDVPELGRDGLAGKHGDVEYRRGSAYAHQHYARVHPPRRSRRDRPGRGQARAQGFAPHRGLRHGGRAERDRRPRARV